VTVSLEHQCLPATRSSHVVAMVSAFVSMEVRLCVNLAYRCIDIFWERRQIKFHEWSESSDCLFNLARILERVELTKGSVPESHGEVDNLSVCTV
jgi:hypothetical protein